MKIYFIIIFTLFSTFSYSYNQCENKNKPIIISETKKKKIIISFEKNNNKLKVIFDVSLFNKIIDDDSKIKLIYINKTEEYNITTISHNKFKIIMPIYNDFNLVNEIVLINNNLYLSIILTTIHKIIIKNKIDCL